MFGIDTTTIRGQAQLAGVALIGMALLQLLAAGGLGLFGLRTVGGVSDRLVRTEEQVFPLYRSVQEARLDVLQVQQFLSDVSATRGQNGLDDGFRQADAFATRFHADVAAALVLARQAGVAPLVGQLSAANDAFPAYFAQGRAMARAYVADGPAAGNRQMPEFDRVAESLTRQIQAAADSVGALVARDRLDAEAAVAAAHSGAILALSVVVVVALAAIALVVALTRRRLADSEMLCRAAGMMRSAAAGELHARITRITRSDEIGTLLCNANRLLDLTEAFAKEANAVMVAASRKHYYRTIAEEGMRGEFTTYVRQINSVVVGMAARDADTLRFTEQKVLPVLENTGQQTEELRQSASSLNGIAHQTIERSIAVASAAEQATVNVQSVASAAVELSASIGEINRQMGESSALAGQAVASAREANHTVDGLNAAAQKIGDVVKLIRDIAGQTNLLALNATIEAARAGEAGKGFAVVASEVKTLANQTAHATEEITAQIQAMQRITTETVQAIQGIGAVIGTITTTIEAVAGAVNAQGEATAEISRNVQEAATGTREVAQNIAAVTRGARETEAMAGIVHGASERLASQAATLQHDMGAFMDRVRQA